MQGYLEQVTVCIDDSGTHDGSEVVCAAGLIGRAHRWAKLRGDWDEVLRRAGVPYFHLVELQNFKGPYARWSETDRQQLFQAVADICAQHLSCPIGCGVLKAAYEAGVPEPVRQQVGSPFILAMQGVLHLSREWAQKDGYTGKIDYVMDAGIAESSGVKALFKRIRANTELSHYFQLGMLTFAACQGTPELQAADYHAYEMYRAVRNEHVLAEEDRRRVRPSVRLLLAPFGEDARYYTRHLNAQGIAKWLELRKNPANHML